MKSMLYEASNVPKAVEKAWSNSGRPEEFTIRVYEVEKKGFFGFTKKYAVVSIVFDARKVEKRAGQATKEKPKHHTRKKSSKNYERSSAPRYENHKRHSNKDIPTKAYKPREEENNEPKENNNTESYNSWSSELTNYVSDSLKDIVKIMDIRTKYSIKVDKHLLKVEFDKPLMEAPSEERMLFSSFAYLLMQFMKRKYKKGFRGCRIAIASARR